MTSLWMFLQQTAAASLTALFLLLLQRLFLDKLSPRWQYGVWLVLLLRLLVPVGIGGRTTVLDVSLWVDTLRVQAELALPSAYSSPFGAALPFFPLPFPPLGAPRSVTDWLFLLSPSFRSVMYNKFSASFSFEKRIAFLYYICYFIFKGDAECKNVRTR